MPEEQTASEEKQLDNIAASLRPEENKAVIHKEVEEKEEDVDDDDDDVDDVLSLEKILSTELKNVSASFVTWQTSPDKKYKLCIFYVRFHHKELFSSMNYIFIF